MFKFTCPPVENQVFNLQRICKLCRSSEVVIKQTLCKQMKDSVESEVKVIRLRCNTCRYSFRVYPQGIRAYSSRTKRLVFLGVVLYAAGLSYEKCSGFLEGMLGRRLESFMTIWRDVQILGEKLRRSKTVPVRTKRQGRVVGIDGTYVKVRGKEQPVIVSTNTTDGTTITVSLQNEWKEQEILAVLKQTAKELGVAMKDVKVVSDDLIFYKYVTQKQKLSHQVCLTHLRKNTRNRLRKIHKLIPKEYESIITHAIDPPTQKGEQQLRSLLEDNRLWQHGEPNKHWVLLRNIIGDILNNWKYYAAYLTDPTLPQTNNRTEQAIGRSKVRYKTTRGFKSQQGVLNFFTLTQTVGMKHFERIATFC